MLSSFYALKNKALSREIKQENQGECFELLGITSNENIIAILSLIILA